MIPYGRQNIQAEDIEAVTAVLQSDFLTQGPSVTAFEHSLCRLTGAYEAVAVNSATSALHLACLALELGPQDWLWTSPNSFVASANCALYCGAQVDFVDIDPHTYNLCPKALATKLEHAKKMGRLPKVLVPVHFAGQSCEMAEIHALAQRYGIRVIEDASHAVGAWHEQQRVGACQYSDITVFSFHPVKIITTGEGGALLTQSPELAKRLRRLSSHGITRDPEQMQGESEGAWYYQQIELGCNYRMTDLQAALGVSQLTRLDQLIAKRHELAARYTKKLREDVVLKPFQAGSGYSALHLYPIQLLAHDRAAAFKALRDQGIGVNVHYIPIHTQPFYQQKGFKRGQYPHAEAYYQQALSLPMFPDLTQGDQDYVIDCVNQLDSVKALSRLA